MHVIYEQIAHTDTRKEESPAQYTTTIRLGEIGMYFSLRCCLLEKLPSESHEFVHTHTAKEKSPS